MGLGSNIGHGLFVGWVEHPDIFCWVSPPPADQPTCQPFLCYQRNPTKWPKIGPSPISLIPYTFRHEHNALCRSPDAVPRAPCAIDSHPNKIDSIP
jgi:hypothetical protein